MVRAFADDVGPGGAAQPVAVVAAHRAVGDDEADYDSYRWVLRSATNWHGGVRDAPITAEGPAGYGRSGGGRAWQQRDDRPGRACGEGLRHGDSMRRLHGVDAAARLDRTGVAARTRTGEWADSEDAGVGEGAGWQWRGAHGRAGAGDGRGGADASVGVRARDADTVVGEEATWAWKGRPA
ncbi:hypothetical protein B0H14DRAFT_2580913 [Mycena olivaceomarginata]|nr:hypothetical protein B0H14DRAFT_2580913 [Mycena olivaceomarginata]